MQPEGNWITRAPSLRRKAILMAKVQDEAGHGLYLYCAAETLGVDRAELIELPPRRPSEVLEHLQLPDADVGRRRRDRMARRRRGDHQPDPAVPLLVRAVRAGDGACLQGGVLPPATGLRAALRALAREPGSSSAMAQDAVNRWWWPSIEMFGPPDTESTHSAQSMAWGIKRFSNDELRQRFVDMVAQQIVVLGLTAAGSRPCAGTRSAATTTSARRDLEELRRVVSGDGPCNRQRARAPPQGARGRRVGARSCRRVRGEARRR